MVTTVLLEQDEQFIAFGELEFRSVPQLAKTVDTGQL
jgi:hypothetical protein